MYKILIADDNELARTALKKSIKWDELDCELVAEASDGDSANEMIDDFEPDIALLDIKMPGKSGMDIVERFSGTDRRPLFIMVTAYDDFDYMRKGMQYGVQDYLLKPVDDSELMQVLHKAVRQLKDKSGREDHIDQELEKYKAKLKETEDEIEEKLFHDSINGLKEPTERLFRICKEKYGLHDYALVLVAPENMQDKEWLQGFIGSQKDIAARIGSVVKSTWRKEGYLLLLTFKMAKFSKEYNVQAISIANDILNKNKELGYQVYITISQASSNFDNITQLFDQCIFAKNGRFFLENKTIVHYASLQSKGNNSDYFKMKALHELYDSCKESDGDIRKKMDELLEQFKADETYDVAYIKNNLIQAVMLMCYAVNEKAVNSDGFVDVQACIKELSDKESISDTFDWMRGFAETIEKQLSNAQDISPQARSILDYLHLHYVEDITLDDVSEYVGITGTHVSRILKKETGETFVTCLNKIRTQEAVKLLKSGQYKVYEIAEMVGYSNYAYFYQTFKKYTGVSPNEYV